MCFQFRGATVAILWGVGHASRLRGVFQNLGRGLPIHSGFVGQESRIEATRRQLPSILKPIIRRCVGMRRIIRGVKTFILGKMKPSESNSEACVFNSVGPSEAPASYYKGGRSNQIWSKSGPQSPHPWHALILPKSCFGGLAFTERLGYKHQSYSVHCM